MAMKYSLGLLLMSFVLLGACNNQPGMEGLWVVQKVKVGTQEMTPNARWMRFYTDGTQESGNGGFQHSYGTYSFDTHTEALSVHNENGIKDNNGAFTVLLSAETMVWKRTEEGQPIEIHLNRAQHLPQSYVDQVLGLWQLEEASGKGIYLDARDENRSKTNIFFRWDKRFVLRTAEATIHGVYNVHAHKPELELIPYAAQYKRNFWKLSLDETTLGLQLLNTDSIVSRSFTRIHAFPEE